MFKFLFLNTIAQGLTTKQSEAVSKDDTIYINFKKKEKSSKEQKKIVDDQSFVIHPKQAETIKAYIKIINMSQKQLWNFSVMYGRINETAADNIKIFTSYLDQKPDTNNQQKIQESYKNKIILQDCPFNYYTPKVQEVQKNQETQEESNPLLDNDVDYQKSSQEIRANMKEKQKKMQQMVSKPPKEINTHYLRMNFDLIEKGKSLTFTNDPEIIFESKNKKNNQFKRLQFKFQDDLNERYLPQLQIVIKYHEEKENQPEKFTADLQIYYPGKKKHMLQRKSILLKQMIDFRLVERVFQNIKRQIDIEKMNQLPSYDKKSQNRQFVRNQTKAVQLISGKKVFRNQNFKNIPIKQIQSLIETQVIQHPNQMTLNQSQQFLQNCYWIAQINQMLRVCPGFLTQKKVLHRSNNKVFGFLNVDGSKRSIVTSDKLYCYHEQDQTTGQYKIIKPISSTPCCKPQQPAQKKNIFKKQEIKEDKIFKQQQLTNHPQVNLDKEVLNKYKQSIDYMFVQKCMGIYYTSYKYLQGGTAIQPNMIIADANTLIYRSYSTQEYLYYFQKWRRQFQQENDQKYTIVLAINRVRKELFAFSKEQLQDFYKFSQDPQKYKPLILSAKQVEKLQKLRLTSKDVKYYYDQINKLRQIFGDKISDFVQHAYSFQGYYEMEDLNKTIIKLKDCRRGSLEDVQQLWQNNHQPEIEWLKNQGPKLLKNQFYLTLEEMKALKMIIYIGLVNTGDYFYSSRQICLKKSTPTYQKINEYKITAIQGGTCFISIHQDYKRFKQNRHLKNRGRRYIDSLYDYIDTPSGPQIIRLIQFLNTKSNQSKHYHLLLGVRDRRLLDISPQIWEQLLSQQNDDNSAYSEIQMKIQRLNPTQFVDVVHQKLKNPKLPIYWLKCYLQKGKQYKLTLKVNPHPTEKKFQLCTLSVKSKTKRPFKIQPFIRNQ